MCCRSSAARTLECVLCAGGSAGRLICAMRVIGCCDRLLSCRGRSSWSAWGRGGSIALGGACCGALVSELTASPPSELVVCWWSVAG